MNLSLEDADAAILSVEVWMGTMSPEVLRATANSEVLEGLRGAGSRMQKALQAKRRVKEEYKDETGKIIPAVYEPDHPTAIAAVRALGELHERFEEKKGQEINISQQTGVGIGSVSGHSYEERVRVLRERHGLKNDDPSMRPVQEEELVDAEFEEVEEEESSEEEADE